MKQARKRESRRGFPFPELYAFLHVPSFTADRYFYPPEDSDDYRLDVGNEHKLVADVDAQTLIKLVKFFKRGKAPGADTIHNEVPS